MENFCSLDVQNSFNMYFSRSLENDDYSYATATYYLLAERVLASYREERAREVLTTDLPPCAELSFDAENSNENR